MRPVQIAPSVLPVDFSKLGEAITALDAAGVDLVQWDVMDGQFVPNLTFGPDLIASTRHLTKKPYEAHLMVLTPDVMAKRYVEAGCQRLIVHVEACEHLHRTLGNIRELGANAAVALNPSTPPDEIAHVLDLVDLVLVMTVNPGFGGQSFIEECVPKIQRLEAWRREMGLKFRIQVDGGINDVTGRECARAGANVFVSGTHLFGKRNLGQAVKRLRERLGSTDPELF